MRKQEERQQIQLELPDYSLEYHEYLKKQEEKKKETESTVIVIDIY